MERVRRKLARMMAVSIGVMLIGLMAVLGAVVYKAAGTGAPQGTAEAVIELPDGFAVSDTAVSIRASFSSETCRAGKRACSSLTRKPGR